MLLSKFRNSVQWYCLLHAPAVIRAATMLNMRGSSTTVRAWPCFDRTRGEYYPFGSTPLYNYFTVQGEA